MAESGSQTEHTQPSAEKKVRTPKAGRDLPAAILTGLALLVPAVVGLIFFDLLLILVAIVLLGMGVWEVARALESHVAARTRHPGERQLRLPKVPLFLGAAAMPLAAYFGGVESLTLALMVTCVAIVVFAAVYRVTDPGPSIMASIFVACWVPFLISFAVLLLEAGPEAGLFGIAEGNWRLVVVVLLVVSNDTFGYIAGVLFGKHPMAPKVSPKKSWEGFAGSMTGAVGVGMLASWVIFEESLIIGAALGVAVVIAGTAGDFSESMVKRELGLKDMSHVLPGHGGAMDRLDSLVFAMPAAYFVIVALTPESGGVPLGL